MRGLQRHGTHTSRPGCQERRSGTELEATSGWRRSLPAAPATTFEGDHVHVDSSIDPAQIRSIIAQVEAATGIPGGTYTVSIVPDIQVIGSVAGQPVTDHFSSPLRFRLQPDQLASNSRRQSRQ